MQHGACKDSFGPLNRFGTIWPDHSLRDLCPVASSAVSKSYTESFYSHIRPSSSLLPFLICAPLPLLYLFFPSYTFDHPTHPTSQLIGTHSGSFHADEALAVGMLRLLSEWKGADLIRTRDNAKCECGGFGAFAGREDRRGLVGVGLESGLRSNKSRRRGKVMVGGLIDVKSELRIGVELARSTRIASWIDTSLLVHIPNTFSLTQTPISENPY